MTIAALLLASAMQAQSLRPRLDQMIRDTTLGNGLTVIVAENHASPVATVVVTVHTGAFTQQPGEEGVSHLFEHVLFRAFGSRNGVWGSSVGAMNGTYNGSTSTENVSYYITAPSEEIEHGVELLARLVVNPDFRDSDIAEELKVVTGEFDRNASDPLFEASSRAELELWGAAWTRKNPLGHPALISKISRKRLREIYGQYYVPNNAAVIVSGDVSTKKAISWVAKRFAKWERGADPFTSPIAEIPALAASKVLVIPADVPQVTLTMQWHGPGTRADARNTYVADVFSDMLNTSVSPFQERLVVSGLFQELRVNYLTQAFSGPIEITGVTSVRRVDVAIAALRNEIAKFRDTSYRSAELISLAKKRRAVSTEFGLERGSSLAHLLATWWSVAGLDYFRGYTDDMQTVTLDELDAYLAKYISGQPYVLLAIVPRGKEAELTPLITAAFEDRGAP